MVLSHILHFPKAILFIKVGVSSLPNLTFSSSLGLSIICESEVMKVFAQLLAGKPTIAKLHMSKAFVIYLCIYEKENLNTFQIVLLKCLHVVFLQFKFPAS